jgi:general secretion pathway protein G
MLVGISERPAQPARARGSGASESQPRGARAPAVIDDRGFTLLELMSIVTIVGILVTLAVPSYQQSVVKAREAVLTRDLFTIRDLLDQHRADKGKYPDSLKDLVTVGYLKAIPMDPFTRSTSTWQEIYEETEGGVFDIHSGSDLVGTNGVPYNQW